MTDRLITPDESAEMTRLNGYWAGAYRISFEDGRFIARWMYGGWVLESGSLGGLRQKLRDDYGTRPEYRGSDQ